MIFEQRSGTGQSLDESSLDTALRAALGGQAVTVQNALNIPALSGAVEFIAGTVASLPVRLYRTENGRTEEITRVTVATRRG